MVTAVVVVVVLTVIMYPIHTYMLIRLFLDSN